MEARNSFQVTLNEHLNYTSVQKTLEKDLKKHGWIIDKRHKNLNSPDLAALIEKNDAFKEMVNSHLKHMI